MAPDARHLGNPRVPSEGYKTHLPPADSGPLRGPCLRSQLAAGKNPQVMRRLHAVAQRDQVPPIVPLFEGGSLPNRTRIGAYFAAAREPEPLRLNRPAGKLPISKSIPTSSSTTG